MANHLDIFNFRILRPGFVAQGQKPYAYPHFRNERRMQSFLDWSIWVTEGTISLSKGGHAVKNCKRVLSTPRNPFSYQENSSSAEVSLQKIRRGRRKRGK